MTREQFEQTSAYARQQEFPRGPGDPDFYGYPGEDEPQHKTPEVYKHRPYQPWDDGDYTAASPERNWEED